MNDATIHLGANPAHFETQSVGGQYVEMLGETYYRIRHYDQMPPFFMSLVSSSNHWLFVSSTGGLTAGRANAENALFPYETVDKITAHSEYTGPQAIFLVQRDQPDGTTYLWEPFSTRYAGLYRIERQLYKNIAGNKLIFEELNHDLALAYRYAWRTSDRLGFVKSAWLENTGDTPCHISLLDGLQNLLPSGDVLDLQASSSYLLHAYKRNELEPETGLGIFSLSATISDRPEPSEALQATTVWQAGLTPTLYLLSSEQLDAFRQGAALTPETDVRGRPGAYFVRAAVDLPVGETRAWHIVADINQNGAEVVNRVQYLQQPAATLIRQLEADIEAGDAALTRLVAAADGLQASGARLTTAHHFANVMFNIMRGGVFANGYQVETADLRDFVRTRNRRALAAHQAWFDALPATLDLPDLYDRAADYGDPDVQRLCYEYLPLTFSRRHGDPSRPWNRFSINLKHPDGTPRLDYQGNWRDIFQNWQPLAYAFPASVEGMIAKFLNATTADGYNPYRITRDGIEWEAPDPDDPWANIGYWSDHQIIYLQKLLEFAADAHPGRLPALWNRPIFAYADVPYRLRPYAEMLADWYNTIDFDDERHAAILAAVDEMGTDARLHRDANGDVIHVTMIEKLLVLLLAKLTNLAPDGGIWMNTQRPEWNDANNALVGKGLSVVTVAYLRRFVAAWRAELDQSTTEMFDVSETVLTLLDAVAATLREHAPRLANGFTPEARRAVMDALGVAAAAYRAEIYAHGPQANLPPSEGGLRGVSSEGGTKEGVSRADLADFLALAQRYLEATLRANRRPDGLYHAYNILKNVGPQGVEIGHLYAMLEGQVAVLSAGILAPDEALELLHNLRHSDLYRADQHTYLLYPNRDLPGFLEKNRIPAEEVADSALVQALTAADDHHLLRRDQTGNYHFHGEFRNASDVRAALDELAADPDYATLVETERDFILELFEATFNHSAFTGRSGTFFAFEGLGSTYWHMVSKLLLAAQECYFAAIEEESEADAETVNGLDEAYYDIRAGIGFNKTPEEYGAFPTDPYSHTPAHRGAQQPGMTGQVKEEILTRWGELGIRIEAGALRFAPTLLRAEEFLSAPGEFEYVDVNGLSQTLKLSAGTLAFTFCQTPIIYQQGDQGDAPQIEISTRDDQQKIIAGDRLDAATAAHIFNRDGHIKLLRVTRA